MNSGGESRDYLLVVHTKCEFGQECGDAIISIVRVDTGSPKSVSQFGVDIMQFIEEQLSLAGSHRRGRSHSQFTENEKFRLTEFHIVATVYRRFG